AYRTMDNGKPVDASGMLTGTDVDGAFNGVAQLGGMIAKSATAETCVGTQWFRYAMARAEAVADTCSLQQMQKTFHDSGADLRTLPAALVQTPAFMYRRPLAQGSNYVATPTAAPSSRGVACWEASAPPPSRSRRPSGSRRRPSARRPSPRSASSASSRPTARSRAPSSRPRR